LRNPTAFHVIPNGFFCFSKINGHLNAALERGFKILEWVLAGYYKMKKKGQTFFVYMFHFSHNGVDVQKLNGTQLQVV